MSISSKEGLSLPGLDGANPLGFAAALGLMRVLTESSADSPDLDDITMQWEPKHATSVPRILSKSLDQDQDSLLNILKSELAKAYDAHPASKALSKNQEGPDRGQNYHAAVQQSSVGDRRGVDWLTCLGSEALPASEGNQLQTVRRDYFQGNLESLIANANSDHLRRTLFHTWDFSDPLDNHSLHLNPSEDRRHAYQWNRPSGDPERKYAGGMIGANRLALEAWPLFACIPTDETIRTVGFTGVRSNDTRWTWPIWERPLRLSTIKSLLSIGALQRNTIAAETQQLLKYQGIAAVYRSRRILVGKTPNFTPAKRIA